MKLKFLSWIRHIFTETETTYHKNRKIFLLIIIAFLVYYVWEQFILWKDPTASVFDWSSFQKPVLTIVFLLIYISIDLLIMKFLAPNSIYKWFMDMVPSWEQLTPVPKFTFGFIFFFGILYLLVMLTSPGNAHAIHKLPDIIK